MVLVAAGLVILGFFEPFVEAPTRPHPIQMSPYRILVGYDDIGQLDPSLRALPDDARAQRLDYLNRSFDEEPIIDNKFTGRGQPSRIPHCFLTGLLLLAIAVVALWRRQLGLVGSLFTIAGGLGATYGWTRELVLERHTLHAGGLPSHLVWGAAFLVAAGALALLAGVGALLWSDPGGFLPRRTISV